MGPHALAWAGLGRLGWAGLGRLGWREGRADPSVTVPVRPTNPRAAPGDKVSLVADH